MAENNMDEVAGLHLERVKKLAETHKRIRAEISNIIVGQAEVVDDLLTAIFASGHALLIGVPGLAKTLMVNTLSTILNLRFNRIQFTPDLMPADITGTEVLEEDRSTGKRQFRFLHGPVFGNIILADEINRTPPKTQAALLQAMQEHAVSVAGRTHDLPEPFFVLATQNPIEQEGTYPLPEAQLDRFMFSLNVGYPSAEEELQIGLTTTGSTIAKVQPLLDAETVLGLQQTVRAMPVSQHVGAYAVRLVRATRPGKECTDTFLKQYTQWGAGPRAVQYLILGAKSRAVLEGTTNVSCAHIRAVAPIVLRHRVLVNFAAEADGVSPDDIVRHLLENIAVQKD